MLDENTDDDISIVGVRDDLCFHLTESISSTLPCNGDVDEVHHNSDAVVSSCCQCTGPLLLLLL